MFLINGLDLTIVGFIDFQAVGYYAIAASLITFFSGAHGAVCNALMTPVAALHASGEIDRIQRLILKATRITTIVNVLATILVCLFGRFILQAWVGTAYTHQALPIVEILMVANAMRLVANPYAFVLIATGLQTRAVAQGGVEGVINLAASLVGVFWLGPIGVALGTLVGAVCGLAWTCLLTVKHTTEISLGRRRFVGDGIVRPFLCSLPLLIYTAVMNQREFTVASAVLLAICGMLTFLLIERFGNVLPRHTPLAKAAVLE
jgi:O-antigen/teichoic acid export membrane protein